MKRIDLHIHSIFSDGDLIPSEIARRAKFLGHEAIAITDHVDHSNIYCVENIIRVVDDIEENWEIKVIPGVEITHVPPEVIEKLANKARNLGAEIILVHGESLVEPVAKGTNHAAVECPEVDILAHPGLISYEDAEIAKENDVALEITSRAGHCLSNGHVAKIAVELDIPVVVNSDAHSPEDLIDYNFAYKLAIGSGLPKKIAKKALDKYPKRIINR